jgi:hypothetical protein
MPRCIRCRRVGDVEGWGRRRNGWLKQLCPDCDAAHLASHTCRACGVSAAERHGWGRFESGALKSLCPDCDARWQAKLSAYSCRRCGTTLGERGDWGRYERNGRLKVLCPDCDARLDSIRGRNAHAKAAGYICWANTPDGRRAAREREAAQEGRDLQEYVPQAERERRARLAEAELLADRIRSAWAREWLRPFRKTEKELYWEDPDYREQNKAEYRMRYARRIDRERARCRRWAASHPEERKAHQALREERMLDSSDGSATPQAIARLKRRAIRCAYCDCVLTEKQTDHMKPLLLGGEHSLRNIVIVCPHCNGRKAKLSYAEWIERAGSLYRERLLQLYRERYGEALAA